MIKQNPTWQIVREKQAELQKLVDTNWKNGEYHIAAIGERTLRTVNGSLEESEHAINVTTTFQESITRLQELIINYNSSLK